MPTEPSSRLRLMVIVGTSSRLDPVEHARAALRGGSTAIQLRMKGTPTRSLVDTARELRVLTSEAGALLIINDRVDVAMAIEADGTHLGDDDLPLEVARRIAPSPFILGRSVDNASDAEAAVDQGADYVGLGPIFPTPSKSDTGPVVGVVGIEPVRRCIGIPIVAIGGIGLKEAAAVAAAGADGIAVIGAIASAPDPETATREILEEFRRGKPVPREGREGSDRR